MSETRLKVSNFPRPGSLHSLRVSSVRKTNCEEFFGPLQATDSESADETLMPTATVGVDSEVPISDSMRFNA